MEVVIVDLGDAAVFLREPKQGAERCVVGEMLRMAAIEPQLEAAFQVVQEFVTLCESTMRFGNARQLADATETLADPVGTVSLLHKQLVGLGHVAAEQSLDL